MSTAPHFPTLLHVDNWRGNGLSPSKDQVSLIVDITTITELHPSMLPTYHCNSERSWRNKTYSPSSYNAPAKRSQPKANLDADASLKGNKVFRATRNLIAKSPNRLCSIAAYRYSRSNEQSLFRISPQKSQWILHIVAARGGGRVCVCSSSPPLPRHAGCTVEVTRRNQRTYCLLTSWLYHILGCTCM